MKEAKKHGLLRRFARYYKPHLRLFIIDMICALAISLFNLFYPYLTKEVINNYVPNKLLDMLLGASAFILGFFVIKAALNYVMLSWGHIVGVRMQADMRRELFAHLQKLPFAYFDDNKTGVIMSRMTNDLFQVAELAHHGPEDVFLSIITIIGAFVVLATINIYLALIVFAFIPFIVLYAIFMRKRMNRVYSKTRVVQAEINA
ncbi:MAG: ABC transporter ATP-binding protein, partial [Clostridiales bacterium]|nr:ABC transporter ATP-binding protein [Clostridiales bacterium]